MLIKEYRIPLPLTLEEYRIAQLYMIQKKSREESEGEGSGVEIIQNHPYTEGPHGSGQYTYKIFHLERHIPNWCRSIAPKNAFEVHEEAWNAYPYTKTRFSVPFVEKFKLEVDTLFQADSGTQENVFQLTSAELRQREVDVIDIVNDSLSGSDYKEMEDPSLFISEKTGRGPLQPDWIQNPVGGVIMCAYKLIKVEFRYWGLQSKIERFIHDYGLRRVMLRAHRQAWAWQDEWVGLTMEDIRRLERETQIILLQKLGREIPDALEEEEEEQEETIEKEMEQVSLEGSVSTTSVTKGEDNLPSGETTGTAGDRRSSEYSFKRMQRGSRQYSKRQLTRGSFGQVPSGTTLASSSHLSPASKDSDNESTFFIGAMETIALPDDDSDVEYFDAQESMQTETSDEEEEVVAELPAKPMPEETEPASTLTPPDFLPIRLTPCQSGEHLLSPGQEQLPGMGMGTPDSPCTLPLFPPSRSRRVLLLVFHGGGVLHSSLDGISKDIDMRNFSQIVNDIMKVHYQYAINQVSIRLVRCPNICTKALDLLCLLHPVQIQATDCSGLLPVYGASRGGLALYRRRFTDSLPLNVIALLGSECPTYLGSQVEACKAANAVYNEFLNSEEGKDFNGQVCLVTDCLGSILAYDILTSAASRSRTPSPSPRSSSHSSPIFQSSPPPILPQPSPTRMRVTVPLTARSSKAEQHRRKESVPTFRDPHLQRPVLVEVNGAELSEEVAFAFDVDKVFSFGSPLGLVLASRKLKNFTVPLQSPKCTAFCNFFYSVDPLSSRIEPLIDPLFASIQPIFVPQYHRYPTGDQTSTSLRTTVARFPQLFNSSLQLPLPLSQSYPRKAASIECLAMSSDDDRPRQRDEEQFCGLKPFCDWWGQERVDYFLESPPGLEKFDALPNTAYAQIIQSRYWEAKELVSFIIRQSLSGLGADASDFQTPCANCVPFIPPTSTVKWAKKKTSIRIQHMSPNHRACDMVIACLSAQETSLAAKFNYGPLDVASLRGEMVDVYILKEKGAAEGGAQGGMPSTAGAKSYRKEWKYLDSISTDKHGKVIYSLTPEPPLPEGFYPITFLVKGDHTVAYSNLFVIPPQSEAVVFSIDGAFSSNFSLSAKDMKLKEGSVEVARLWQSLGYLIIYITGRPDIQKQYVMSWLGSHGFPLGVVAFSDSLSTDSSNIKRLYLARLIKEARVILYAAYGSHRHLGVYRELGLQPDQIFIHGKPSGRKSRGKQDENCQYLSDGFEVHLKELRDNPPRPAAVDIRRSFETTHFCPTGVAGGNPLYGSPPKRKKRAAHHKAGPNNASDSDL